MTTSRVELVIDTNVAVVANGEASQAGRICVLSCIASLRSAIEEFCILLDDGHLILSEYKNRLSHSGQPGVGDAFFKWVHDNQANPAYSRKVTVNADAHRGFVEFPNDPDLSSFDQADRKFVAVALASGTNPKILNASDTDWWHHRTELQRNGIDVTFLCPELMPT